MDPKTVDLCKVPAGKSPNGKYNFVDPPSLGPAIIAVGATLLAVSTAFTAVRLFLNRKKLRSADYCTLLACLFNIAYTGVIVSQHDSHRHGWDIPVCWYTGHFFQLVFVQTLLFTPTFIFSKAAIFLLYRQLFATGKQLRLAINIGLVITLLCYLSNIPLAAVYAAPDAGKPWTSLLLKLQTVGAKFSTAGLVQSVVGTVMDLYIFVLPLPTLLRLHLPLRRRVQLVGVFSLALLGVAASVVSIYFKAQLLSSHDLSWLGAQASLCTLVETNVAIIVGCMPACAQLLSLKSGTFSFIRSLRSRLLGSRRSGATSSGSGKMASSKGSSAFTQPSTDRTAQMVPRAEGGTYKQGHSRGSNESDTWPLQGGLQYDGGEARGGDRV